MKYDLIRPIAMTFIAITSLKTVEKRTQLLNGNLWLWAILLIFVASWVGFFVRKNKNKEF